LYQAATLTNRIAIFNIGFFVRLPSRRTFGVPVILASVREIRANHGRLQLLCSVRPRRPYKLECPVDEDGSGAVNLSISSAPPAWMGMMNTPKSCQSRLPWSCSTRCCGLHPKPVDLDKA
jgi:hypothetical protein